MIKLLKNERGSAVTMVSVALAAIIGFTSLVADIGLLYVNRAKLENMTDAAALAAVQDLPVNTTQAQLSGQIYAEDNGEAGDRIEVTVPGSRSAMVTASRTIELFFARFFGITTADVNARAAAVIKPLSATTGVVPFGVVKQDFIYGQTYSLKVAAGDGYTGNYDALALGGTGSQNYTDNVKYGYDAKLSVGQWVVTETGNMSGGTTEGVKYRLNLDPTTTFETVDKGSPRVIIIPVIESIATDTGRHDVKIVGFAGFFLEAVGGAGKENYVTGKFMQVVRAGEISDTATNYGVYGAALVPYESVANVAQQ